MKFFSYCFNNWLPQQLASNIYSWCVMFVLLLQQCDTRLMARKSTDIVQYFQSEKNNQQWLWSNILKVTKTFWKLLLLPFSHFKFAIHILEDSWSHRNENKNYSFFSPITVFLLPPLSPFSNPSLLAIISSQMCSPHPSLFVWCTQREGL